MRIFYLPPIEKRMPKLSIYTALNLFTLNRDLPWMYACYFLTRVYHLVVLVYAIVVLSVYLAHRHYGLWPNLMITSESENYFELYMHLLNYSGGVSLLFLFICLYWLNKKYSFKGTDYTEPSLLANKKPSALLSKPSMKVNYYSCIIGLILFLPLLLFPSFSGIFFYKEKFGGYFISQFDNTAFIIFAALFIAFWQNFMFQINLILSVIFLSLKHQIRRVRKEEN